VLILCMIEVLPPLEKYKYDTWRIVPVKCYIHNFMQLRSCIRNVNKHFCHRYRGGSQYLLYIYRLHGIILASIISLADLSASLCLCLVFAGRCMTGFDLQANYHSDLESLIRKSRSKLSSPGSLGSHVRDIVDKIQGSPLPQEPEQMAGRKCINDFLSPSSRNARTRLEMNIGDGSFKLKPALPLATTAAHLIIGRCRNRLAAPTRCTIELGSHAPGLGPKGPTGLGHLELVGQTPL
jgi:hypothetical protein